MDAPNVRGATKLAATHSSSSGVTSTAPNSTNPSATVWHEKPHSNHLWRNAIDDHVLALDWSPDGQTLAVADVSGPVTLFNLDGTRRFTLPAHGFGTMSMRFQPCPDSSLLATSGQDGKIRL
ncbi:MAG: WD40 repeat domain-containing protein [Anaerolineales bacterium]|nr:WD40 repeat domain-containing protein [Anaerolineales bacterium]